jgi:integrase
MVGCRVCQGEIRPRRAIVDQVVGILKTEASGEAVPMDSALAGALLNWSGRCPSNQDADFLFGSPDMDGQQPYWPHSLLKVICPAAVRAGIRKHIGWHSFRRTLATLLQANGVSVRATQDILRHASSRLTMDLYAQSIPADRRAAQSEAIGAVLAASVPKCSHDNL